MNVGDFVAYYDHVAIIIESFLTYESYGDSLDGEYEDSFTIKILESEFYTYGEELNVLYFALDKITDEKEISRLRKIMVFK